MKIKTSIIEPSAVALGLLISAAAMQGCYGQGTLIYNGSFEQETDGWVTLPVGGVQFGYPEGTAADGDAWGVVSGPGAFYQDVVTVPGQPYELRFAMAGNPAVPEIAHMNVYWGAELVAIYNWDSTGSDFLNRGWIHGQHQLVASEAVTRLTFENQMQSGYLRARTIMLDNVVLTPVPEPTATSLVAVGTFLLGLLGWRNRRRASPGG